MLDKETKSKLEKFIAKINETDSRIYSVEIAFGENFIYLQFEVRGDGVQHVLRAKDFINGMYDMGSVYTAISDEILKIIAREYSIKLSRALYDR